MWSQTAPSSKGSASLLGAPSVLAEGPADAPGPGLACPCSTSPPATAASAACSPCAGTCGTTSAESRRSWPEHPVEADQVQPLPRDRRRRPLHGFRRRYHQVRVPSRRAVLSLSTTWPAALICTRSSGSAGPVMQRHSCSSRLQSCAWHRTAACTRKPSMSVRGGLARYARARHRAMQHEYFVPGAGPNAMRQVAVA